MKHGASCGPAEAWLSATPSVRNRGLTRSSNAGCRDILEEMQVPWHRSQESRRQALAFLESISKRHTHSLAASWNVNTTAREFLQRHRTGARFAALPVDIQDQALEKLRAWAETTFGSRGRRLSGET